MHEIQVRGPGRPGARPRGRLRRSSVVVAAGVVVGGLTVVSAPSRTVVAAPASLCPDATIALFGPNVCVFNSSMSQAAIQADINAISTQQVPIGSQFDSQRYAILFQPGTYGSATSPLEFQVGYYTQVAGLGAVPQATVINGAIEVYANAPDSSWYDSTDNFWRSLSNLTLNEVLNAYPPGPPDYAPPVVDPYTKYCTYSEEAWSASQATPIRSVIFNGSVVFQDYCSGRNDFASGGYLANDQVTGHLNFYGNQQYMVRNSQIGGATGCPNGLWNNVYSGVEGAPSPVFTGSCQQNTVVPASPVTEEQPFLYTDSGGNWNAFLPAVQHNTTGPNFLSGAEAGSSVAIQHFFVASPDTPVAHINFALAHGKDLILTPGVYNLDQPIEVSRPDTVVMGLGFATLVAQDGNAAMAVASNTGVKLSGIIIDAGPVNSPVLLSVGAPGPSSPGNPDLIQDIFFRVGGAETTSVGATVSLVDNASNSIIDDVWAWRADHGATAGSTGWTVNTGDTGVIVTGDNVTAYGLAVEHYQKYEVVWSGQNGTDIFFQNELPYDPPTQAAWMASPTQDGYPAFEVTPNVTSFNGYGMGSYVVFISTTATLYDAEAFESPSTPGVRFHDVFTVWIAGSGGYNSVVNGIGGPDTSTNPGLVEPVDVGSYP
jgi:hypothetical protein